MLVAAFTWDDLWKLALAVFLFAVGITASYLLVRLAGTVDRLSAFIRGTEKSVLPVVDKVGGSVDRVNVQLDKVDQHHRQRRGRGGQRRHGGAGGEPRPSRVPCRRSPGFAAGVSFGAADFKAQPRLAPRRAGGEGGCGPARERSPRRAAGRAGSDDRRDPARHTGGGGLQADRPPRHRRPRDAARRDVRRPRRPAGRARGAARAPRRRRTSSSSPSRPPTACCTPSLGPFPPEKVHAADSGRQASTCSASSRPSATRTRSRSATAARGSS